MFDRESCFLLPSEVTGYKFLFSKGYVYSSKEDLGDATAVGSNSVGNPVGKLGYGYKVWTDGMDKGPFFILYASSEAQTVGVGPDDSYMDMLWVSPLLDVVSAVTFAL